MSKSTATLSQFQSYVWELLPMRREAIGREMADDIVTVAVQFWPNEELSATEPGSPEEALVLDTLVWSVKRVLELIYGEERFGGYWLLGVRMMVPLVIEVMARWWRRRKDNKAKIVIWRRKWTNE